MGRIETPVRRLFNYAVETFLARPAHRLRSHRDGEEQGGQRR